MKLSLLSTFAAVIIGALALPQGPGGGGSVTCPGGQSTSNSQCCVWFDVLDDLQTNFYQGSKCESPVRKILRIVFHDAIGFSPALTAAGQFGGGGADGSIIAHSNIELAFPANGGLTDTIEALRAVGINHGVSFGDLIQFATAVGMSNCPGSPRLEFLTGRSNSSQPSPPSLIPGPGNTVTAILDRMGDAGFSPDEVVDLLAAHSLASQEGLNSAIFRSPLDSTPQVFDTQFYIETLLKGTTQPGPSLGFAEELSPFPGEFRMRSDALLARDSRTACRWQSMTSSNEVMGQRYRAAMAKMSVLGFDRNALTDCSDVIPSAVSNNAAPVIPGGLTVDDIEVSCPSEPFPEIATASGPLPSLAPAP
nr:peroxidase [Coprinopsis cinerea]